MLFCSFRPLLVLSSAAFGASLLALSPAIMAQTSVLTQNNDNARSGANTQETRLTPTNVNVQTFGAIFKISGLEANVNGQPLYVPNLAIGGIPHNTLFVYTSNNADHSPCGLWAFDADTGNTLWHDTLPNSATYTTATPTIDPAASIVYVLSKTDNDDTGSTFLHAFDLTTGKEKKGSPIQVQASAPGTGDGSVNGVVFFDGDHGNGRLHANDRVGLLFSQGTVYAAFAHNSDSNPYHGWILGYQYNGTQFTQKYVFCTTPNGSASTTPGGADGGIWQAGKGLTADASGNIYCTVGNGTFDANTGGNDYGMCCLKLSPALTVLDWFAPFDESTQSNQDLDMGNSGVTSIPGTDRLFVGGTKFGSAFLLDGTTLGHFTPNGPDAIVARVDGVSSNDDVGQNAVAWDAGGLKYVYLWPGGSALEQFRYDPSVSAFNPGGIDKQSTQTAGGSLAISSNGTSNGIVWAVGYDGVVRAYGAGDVSGSELWDSGQNSGRDGLGSVGHFQFPTVVNGKVYVPTGNASVAVYGLLPPPAVFRVAAGGSAAGSYSADTNYHGGSTSSNKTTHAISVVGVSFPAPQSVYQTKRTGNFTYILPGLTPGRAYTLRLHFAEFINAAPKKRQFNVSVNGKSVLTNFDIFAAAGGEYKAVVQQFSVTADNNGRVTVQFSNGAAGNADLNGLELLQ